MMAAWAGAWGAPEVYTPADVPNVQVQDRSRFVSDPAHLMGDAARAKADAALGALRDSTSVEVAVVILPSIGEQDIFDFSHKLARKWGIGKGDKDNGLLVLYDMGGRQVRLHTGQGMEGVLPDVACTRIIRETVIPPLKTNDLDNSVLDLTERLTEVFTDPDAAAELRSAQEDTESSPISVWYLLIVPIVATVTVYGNLFNTAAGLRGKSDAEKAQWLHRHYNRPTQVLLVILTLGLGLPAVLIRGWMNRHYRNKPRKCDVCGTPMKKLDEDADNAYLTPSQDMEEKLGSVDYDVWLCPKCGATEIFPFHDHNSTLEACPACGTHACAPLYDRITLPPTPTRKGQGVKVYECRHCHKRYEKRYDIPATGGGVPPVIMGGGGGFRGGGGSMGGGFGGGSFGGGGSSGSW